MRVAVIGSGRQGPAAAYDLTQFASADVVLVDADLGLARAAARRVASLAGRSSVQADSLDVRDPDRLREFLARFDLAVAAAPYRLNPLVVEAGIDVGCSVVDMGLDTPDALRLLARSDEAVAKGVRIVTDCGIAPGTVNVLAALLIEEHPDTHTVRLYCGGLPEAAEPPFFHKVGFSVESLLGEYVDDVDALRDGEIVTTRPLEGLEVLEFEELGTLEAATTSGGTGTAAHFLPKTVRNYEYKTLRYPGHWAAMRMLRDAGFWDENPVDGVVPRRVSLALMERHMVDPQANDVVATRVVAEGPSGIVGYEFVDRYDVRTGLSAMQRTTGFSTAIVAAAVLHGEVPPGCHSCERALSPGRFVEELCRRGLKPLKISPK